jgi:rRNA maturation endonuclease Nob1
MIEAPGVKCLMCGAAMLRKLRCSKHRDAKRWLGSVVLRSTVVLAAFPKSMDCPYCGGHYKLSRTRSRSGRKSKKQVSSL